MKKKILGQFFTDKNIFTLKPFQEWFNNISDDDKKIILEPFAGKNGLINMLLELKYVINFNSFDIEPQNENVKFNDSILNFPKNYSICVTNPPFLAKNVSTRKKIPVEIEPFSDLYEKCLDLCLKNCKYVAAIVPESFIVSPFFKNRVHSIISLPQKNLFKETEQPVCLALFSPNQQLDYIVYENENIIGFFHEKEKEIKKWLDNKEFTQITFHKKDGQLGLFNIDATNLTKKINFNKGNLIDNKDVGYHARLRTRIEILTPKNKILTDKQLEKFIMLCNKNLKDYREKTKDIFLTSFKGIRSDGKYRRRLDYSTARLIVNKSYAEFFKIKD